MLNQARPLVIILSVYSTNEVGKVGNYPLTTCAGMFTHRQCFSTLLLSAIFSPTSVHTGCVRAILARSAFTALTLPPVDRDPIFTINTSLRLSFWTYSRYTYDVHVIINYV